ncbi:MAG: PorV/PorQ family protein [Elusimicrobiota bacterium]|nr:PorV/PorQ family protein [Elusimicrobiota bacterium]
MTAGFLRAHFTGFFLLCLTAPAIAFASGPGTTAANFLKIPVGARETSLGGAFTAVADNADAVFYNPAGLGLLEAPEFAYAYNNYLPGVSQQWLAAAYPAASGTFGIGANYLGVKAFDSYDSADNRTGSVSAYDMAVYFGYGGRLETASDLLPSVRYGAAVKYISEKLDTGKATGYGLDAGLLLLPGVKNLRFGLGVENLAASRLEFIREGAKPPLNFKTGVSYGIATPGGAAGALVSLDLNFPEDGPRYLAAGIENTLYGALALRAGYSSFGDLSNGVSFGLGFTLPARGGREIRLDYSYGTSYDFGNVHKFGLACKFGAGRAAAAPEPAAAQRAQERGKEAGNMFKQQLDLLYSDSPEESRAAAEYLAGLDNPMVIEHFTALLSSGKAGWKLAAVHGLARQKDSRSLDVLAGALTHEDPEVRQQAAQALGSRGVAGSAAALQAALRREESDSVKSAIIEALGKLSAQR